MSPKFPYISSETHPLHRNKDVYGIEGDEKNVIRELFTDVKEDPKVLEDKIREIRELFSTFEQETGIRVVKSEYIIANHAHKGWYQIDAFSERIDGENLDDTLEFTDPQAAQIEELLKKLWEYFKNSYNKKGVIFSDIFVPHQYVLGKRAGEDHDKIYLVDIDPITEKDYSPKNLYKFLEILDDLLNFCAEMENKNLDIKPLREDIQQTIENINKSELWARI